MTMKSNTLRRYFCTALLAGALCTLAYPNCAELIGSKYQISKKKYDYYANKTDIATVLTSFGRYYGIRMRISEEINGPISGTFSNMAPLTFFNGMLDAYNAICYLTDATMYIYSSEEIATENIQIAATMIPTFMSRVLEAGLIDPAYPLQEISGGNMIIVSGPPRYIEILNDIRANMSDVSDTLAHRIIKLKYKNVEDTSVNNAGMTQTTFGMSTILNNIVRSKSGKDKNIGTITYDASSNSIILYNNMRSLDEYEKIIKDLDKPNRSVRIKLKIIDLLSSTLNSTDAEDLTGVLSSLKDQKQFSSGVMDKIMGAISTLSRKQSAKIVSEFTIMGYDNMPSSIVTESASPPMASAGKSNSVGAKKDTERDIFLRGKKQDLSGSKIYLRPKIIEDSSGTNIHLSINIEHSYSGYSSPNKNKIITEIKLKDGKFTVLSSGADSISGVNTSGDPILSKIPILGNMFFKYKNHDGTKTLRLFIVYAKAL